MVGNIQILQITFPVQCNGILYYNIIPINVNFVNNHETGSSSGKIIKNFVVKNP